MTPVLLPTGPDICETMTNLTFEGFSTAHTKTENYVIGKEAQTPLTPATNIP